MYIRRKVFSILQDEMGEERYFSTTDFELATEERMYAEGPEESGVRKVVNKVKEETKEIAGKTKEAAKKTAGKTKEVAVKGANKVKAAGESTGKFIKDAWRGERAILRDGLTVDAQGRVHSNSGKIVSKANAYTTKKVGMGKTGNRIAMIATPIVAAAGTAAAVAHKKRKAKKSEE